MMNGIRKTPRQVFQDTVCKINVASLCFKDEHEIKEFVVTCRKTCRFVSVQAQIELVL